MEAMSILYIVVGTIAFGINFTLMYFRNKIKNEKLVAALEKTDLVMPDVLNALYDGKITKEEFKAIAMKALEVI